MSRLLVLGLGYCARRFIELHGARFADIVATVRTPVNAETVAPGIAVEILRPCLPPTPDLIAAARVASHVLVSVPPGEDGDTALTALGADLAGNPDLVWVGYLSTTGIYGDHAGGWVSEDTPPTPGSARAHRRLAAEREWQALAMAKRAVHVFRLSGIYGPGRNALVDLANGEARRLTKPGQVFNRIHVDDIAHAVAAAIERPKAGPVFNLGDDEPAPQDEVVAFAADLLGMVPPPLTAFGDAEMSLMARSFWAENKRIGNRRLNLELGLTLLYPTYREGLRALHVAGEGK